ncbi:hypothetical protein C7H09_09210 [Marinobacter fuscus]|uniref:Uncharacterized protein n=1 Tax=Marinobacter fuscus TaxID=2109942 RepID=A0A2T1KDD6_9GAMM|nr:hypothetical protein [Marinobacter fuscus]PSF08137.1 hypothetical protein C7H09_09210 [Marinobacter fuscus]
MTAEELITQLQKLPPETPVLVEGYETGFDEIVELTPEQVVRYRHAQVWDGEYQALGVCAAEVRFWHNKPKIFRQQDV